MARKRRGSFSNAARDISPTAIEKLIIKSQLFLLQKSLYLYYSSLTPGLGAVVPVQFLAG